MRATKVIINALPVALGAIAGKEMAGLKGAVVGALAGEVLRETVFEDLADDITITPTEILKLLAKYGGGGGCRLT